MARAKEVIREELTETRGRLKMYLDQEQKMLTGGVQAYGLGTRNLQRYQMDLANIQAMIRSLKEQIRELEAELNGGSARRALGIVPRDW